MSESSSPVDLFRLAAPEGAPPLQRLLTAMAGPPLERLLGLKRCREIYSTLAEEAPPEEFAAGALAALGVTCQVDAAGLARIPATGPLVVIANHPFGAVEGLMLLAMLRRIRPDVNSARRDPA